MRLLTPKGDQPPSEVALQCDSCDQMFVLEGDDLIECRDDARIYRAGVRPNRIVKVRCPSCEEVIQWPEAEWGELRRRGGMENVLAVMREAEAALESEAESAVRSEAEGNG